MPLKQWVKMAFSVEDYALRAPSWLDTSRFDLNAKFPPDSSLDAKDMAERMRNLLKERFGLTWHEDSQNINGYELRSGKKVLIKAASLIDSMKGHGLSSGPSFIGGHNMSMQELAGPLEQVLGKPVVDATHLPGVFDIKIIWAPSDEAVAAEERRHGIDVDNLPTSVETALREQLGLQLQSAKVPSRVVTVDDIRHVPTDN